MASKCANCDTETKYKCIKCELAVCNKGCSVFAPETTDEWKAGTRVGYCVRCSKTSTPCLVEKKKTENDQKIPLVKLPALVKDIRLQVRHVAIEAA